MIVFVRSHLYVFDTFAFLSDIVFFLCFFFIRFLHQRQDFQHVVDLVVDETPSESALFFPGF